METRRLPVRGVQSRPDINLPSSEAEKPITSSSTGGSNMFDQSPSDGEYQSVVEQAMNERYGGFIAFVQEQLATLRANLMNPMENPSFMELNKALSQHEGVLLTLTFLYEETRYAAKRTKEAYDEWFACKFMEIREECNPRSVAAAKWYSQKEIEMMVRHRFRDDHARLVAAASEEDHKLSTLTRLIDSWNNYQYILSNISKNVQTEVNASLRHVD